MRTAALALLMGLALPGAPGAAQNTGPSDAIVTTRHVISLGDRQLEYTAHAGLIPIRDNEAGDVHARVFFVAYTLDRREGDPDRPLSFVWNGGPGMNSSLIHLLGFGPKRVRTGDSFPTSPPPSETEMDDNQETWLDLTDLVFVDPVGTGYSRPTRPEYADEFYQTPGDTEAIAEFIRVFRVRFDAWNRPLFIVGHSYGTTRAMGVTGALERRGVPVSGVVLISGGISLGQDPLPPEMAAALAVPGMTAAAFYHGKLAPELRGDLTATLAEAEAWAKDEYARSLANVDALTEAERARTLRSLARYTGLDPAVVDPATLTVERDVFKTQLLAAEGRVLGNYDYRLTRPADPTEGPYDIFRDPSFKPAVGLAQGTSPLLNRYMRFELGFESDLLYQGPLGGGYPPATSINRRWVRNPVGAGTPEEEAESTPPLRQAMDANPAIRVFLVRGLYDSLGSGCARHVHTVEHLEGDLGRRVSVACYGAGHDMYTDKEVRQEIKRDMTTFIRRTLAGPP